MPISVDEPTGEGPLRDFWGIGQHETETRKFDNRETLVVKFKFTDLEIIEQVDVFPFPVYEIRINYSNPQASRNKTTRWENFASSLRDLGLKGSTALDQIAGRRQHWKMVPGTVRTRNDETGEFEDLEALVWKVIEVEGIDAPTPLATATKTSSNGATAAQQRRHFLASLADGKSESEFNSAATADSNVRKWTSEMDEITERTLLGALTDEGLLTRDPEGVYHKTDLVVTQ